MVQGVAAKEEGNASSQAQAEGHGDKAPIKGRTVLSYVWSLENFRVLRFLGRQTVDLASHRVD